MNILLQWILAIVIIIIVSAIISGIVMALYWIREIKKVIKNIPADIQEQIKLENAKQEEISNKKCLKLNEKQRRISDLESSSEEKNESYVSIKEIKESLTPNVNDINKKQKLERI
jgi:predicted Holliday junction resolvase-like endonuclease